MMSVEQSGCNYVALLSQALCAMHNWSDGGNIAQRVFCLIGDGTAATRCFSTQRDALCWLTNPVHREAVAEDSAVTEEPQMASADDDGCYAVRTHSSVS